MPQTNRSKSPLIATLVIVMIIVVIIAGVITFINMEQSSQKKAEHYQQLMSLTPLGQPPVQPSNFSLTDQHGQTRSLSSLRGKEVILDFVDPMATTTTGTSLAKEFSQVNSLLSSRSSEVVFIAVNVNPNDTSVKDIQSYAEASGFGKLPNGYVLTGSATQLKPIWKAYGVSVQTAKDGTVQHSSLMYFIDKQGLEQYLANPANSRSPATSPSNIDAWAQGIHWVAEKLL